MRQATATMRKIGLELIEQRRETVLSETEKVAEKTTSIEGDKTVLGRDLLSVLSASVQYGLIGLSADIWHDSPFQCCRDPDAADVAE